MKKLFILSIAAFITAGLFSYKNKSNLNDVLSTESYIACYATDSRNDIQADALKPGFAALHPNPTPFILNDAKGETVNFTTTDGTNASGYLIKSKKKSNKWLFVIQEWWGLNDNIKREADEFSSELDNVNVLAIDMYDGKVATTRDSAMKYMSAAKTERLATIVNGAIAFAGKKAKIYTVGWCFGGAWSLQASLLAGKQASGCIMYYGRPENKVEKLSTLQCDVIGFFGTQDKGIPMSLVDEFEKNMLSLGKKITIHKYDAGHGFANPSNPVFNKDATSDARSKALAFLKERM
jgi:carboxymethylenebutenolidase